MVLLVRIVSNIRLSTFRLSSIEVNFGNNDPDGLKCLHCHIFENMVDIVN